MVAARNPEKGKILFETFQDDAGSGYSCSNCHLPTSEKTNIGPGLLNIKHRAATRIEGLSAAEYIYESITNSMAYTVEGFEADLMPQNWAEIYTDLEIFDIVAYLLTLEGESDIDDPDPGLQRTPKRAPAEASRFTAAGACSLRLASERLNLVLQQLIGRGQRCLRRLPAKARSSPMACSCASRTAAVALGAAPPGRSRASTKARGSSARANASSDNSTSRPSVSEATFRKMSAVKSGGARPCACACRTSAETKLCARRKGRPASRTSVSASSVTVVKPVMARRRKCSTFTPSVSITAP